MPLDPPTLLVAAATGVALASAAAASIGVRQKLRRGVWWWTGANAGLALALTVLSRAPEEAWSASLAVILVLQWPFVALAGLRRFFARGGDGVPAWCDWLAAALAVTAAVAPWWLTSGDVAPGIVLAAAMIAATLYAAVVVSRLEDFATAPMLRSLLFGLACSGIAQVGWLVLAKTALAATLSAGDVMLGAVLATAVTALLMPQLSLAMNHERSVAQLRASHRKLRHLVEVDTLTQLPNRRHFQELATKAIRIAPETASVLVFDVDRLKHINEVLGHALGDEALRQIGTALRETLRRRDVAGRLGGDEFAVVLPRTRVADVEIVISRINARIEDRQVAPRIARVKLNVGVTQMVAGETIADALRRAEIALETARDDARRKADAVISAFASVTHTPISPSLAAAARPAIGLVPISLAPAMIPVGEVTLGSSPG